MKSDQNFDAWLIQCHRMTRRLWVSHCAWSVDLNSRKGVLPGRQLFANWETVTPPSSCCTLCPYYGVHRPCCCTRLRAFSKWPIWSPCTWCIAHWAPDWLHPVASLCLSRRRFQLGIGRSEQRKSRASPASNFLLRYSVVCLHVCQDFVHHLVFWWMVNLKDLSTQRLCLASVGAVDCLDTWVDLMCYLSNTPGSSDHLEKERKGGASLISSLGKTWSGHDWQEVKWTWETLNHDSWLLCSKARWPRWR